MGRKLINYNDVENLIKMSEEIHGKFYNYSKLKSTINREKSIIICPNHGPFEQRIYMHIFRKQGCPKCEGLKMSNDEFIEQSSKIHKNLYLYPRTIFSGKRKKVIITCKIHGDFTQLAYSHLNGIGCSHCAGCAKSNNIEFINKSNKIHNYLYDYSKVNYKNAHIKIDIICKKHGIFKQSPNKHLCGKGCPICNNSKGENLIIKYLLNKNIKFETQYKFEKCKFKRELKFDFYLPEYNSCIEFDGDQHFNKFRFENNDDKLNIRKKRDEIKNIYCEENNIKLYRIKYTENIENKLKEILNDN